MDYSLPGSSTHGIFQARVLEWVAIAFSMWVSYSLFDSIFTQKRTFFKIYKIKSIKNVLLDSF